VKLAGDNGLPVMFVTEDTTRAQPEHLRQVYSEAMRAGAGRICVADMVGHATPEGVRSLIRFIAGVRDEVNPDVGIDWHGHRDRGLGLANTFVAIEAGADRVHACALGIGERSGNTPMEVLLVNLNLMGMANRDLSKLPEYCDVVSKSCGVAIPFNYPIVGADSFRTSRGVHAAAIVKAMGKEDDWLVDQVYCGVPSDLVGRKQDIEIGPMSGEANVRFWLESRGIELNLVYCEKILAAAKSANKLLEENMILRMVTVMQERMQKGEEVSVDDLAAFTEQSV
jgi:2-isopropylmalate synthase